MIKRDITTELLEASGEYPVVTVFGPRQSGKTTLVKMAFPGKSYYSLEYPDVLMAAETDPEQTFRDPLRGGLFENLVITEILKGHLNCGKHPELFFYRDTHGNEVDLIIRNGRKLIPVEIKSAATFTPDFLRGIEQFQKTAGERCAPGFVCYNGSEEYTLKGIRVLNPIKNGKFEAIIPS